MRSDLDAWDTDVQHFGGLDNCELLYVTQKEYFSINGRKHLDRLLNHLPDFFSFYGLGRYFAPVT
jgi:hypothetical protein